MVVEYFHRETGGVVVGMARWPFDDFTHFRPRVLGALSGINLPRPLHTAARDGGADTRCNRAGLFCPPSMHQTVFSPLQRVLIDHRGILDGDAPAAVDEEARRRRVVKLLVDVPCAVPSADHDCTLFDMSRNQLIGSGCCWVVSAQYCLSTLGRCIICYF